MTDARLNSMAKVALTGLLMAALGGCAYAPKPVPVDPTPAPAPVAPASTPAIEAAPAPVVLTSEAILAQGTKAYQTAQYQQAELDLKSALQMGLSKPADIASANKYLAFIYCTSKREALCLAAFKAAHAADPKFALSKSEAGHPMWGPVYKRSLSKK